MSEGNRCVTCGTRLAGRYCHECGEKRREPADLTLRSFAHYAVEAVTNADARLYRTLRILFTQPGLLAREFIAGRRQPFVSPLQLFLLINVVYFVSLQTRLATDAFTTDLAFHTTQPIYGTTARRMLEEKLGELPVREVNRPGEPNEPILRWSARWSEEQAAYRQRFNDASPRYANSLVILMVPIMAVLARMLRRRSLMVGELVFSLHLMAVVLVVLMALPAFYYLLYLTRMPGRHLFAGEAVFGTLTTALVLAWMVPALRRLHGDTLPAAAARSLLLLASLFLAATLYRAMLFFVVFTAVQ
jgi:hypothetical protein